jgi:hypothetical protein
MTKVLKNGVHEDANPINTHHDNPEEKQCTKFFTESDIVSRLTPHCKSDKKRNRGALKGKGGGEKTIDRTEKHRPQPEEANKNIKQERNKRHYNILANFPRPPHLHLNSNAFFLSKMRRRKIRRSQRSRGESGKQKKQKRAKKKRKPIRPLSLNWISNL